MHKHICKIHASKHVKSGKQEQTGETGRKKNYYQPWTQPCNPELSGWLAWEEEESDCGWHSLQSRGAKRCSKHFCRFGQYELQLSTKTQTEMKHRCVAMVIWESVFQTEKQSQKAWWPSPPSQSSPPFTLLVQLQSTLPANTGTGTKYFFPE